MKIYYVIIVIFIFTGCSSKCMNSNIDCTPAEKFMINVVKGASNTAEIINNKTQFMKDYR